MNANNQTNIIRAYDQQREIIISLLQSENLPVEDLPASLNNFFVAIKNEKIIGAIGLEQYGHYGLLRSMVVNKEYRNNHIASHLVKELEIYAATLGIDYMYLLTETAPAYFESKGYERISRESVPEELHVSSEFSHVCPVSAIVMKKDLV